MSRDPTVRFFFLPFFSPPSSFHNCCIITCRVMAHRDDTLGSIISFFQSRDKNCHFGALLSQDNEFQHFVKDLIAPHISLFQLNQATDRVKKANPSKTRASVIADCPTSVANHIATNVELDQEISSGLAANAYDDLFEDCCDKSPKSRDDVAESANTTDRKPNECFMDSNPPGDDTVNSDPLDDTDEDDTDDNYIKVTEEEVQDFSAWQKSPTLFWNKSINSLAEQDESFQCQNLRELFEYAANKKSHLRYNTLQYRISCVILFQAFCESNPNGRTRVFKSSVIKFLLENGIPIKESSVCEDIIKSGKTGAEFCSRLQPSNNATYYGFLLCDKIPGEM